MTRTNPERRFLTRPIEIREAADGTIDIGGYAAVFDQEAYGEVVRSTAFDRTLGIGDDVRLLVNHDGVPIARTKSGTLGLAVDETGLKIEAKGLDPANPTVQELRSALSRGDIDQMSFSFDAVDAGKNADGLRELREVKLYDVSIVTYPWYDETSVELASYGHRLIEARSIAGPLPTLAQRTRTLAALRGAPPGMSSFNDVSDMVCDAICDRIEALAGIDTAWAWIADIGPGWAVYALDYCRDYYQVAWEMDPSGVVTLGEPFEVLRKILWLPATEENDPPPVDAGGPVVEEASAAGLSLAEARSLLTTAV